MGWCLGCWGQTYCGEDSISRKAAKNCLATCSLISLREKFFVKTLREIIMIDVAKIEDVASNKDLAVEQAAASEHQQQKKGKG